MKTKKFEDFLNENDSEWADDEINKWEKEEKKNTISRKELEDFDLEERDLKGGITSDEYKEIMDFVRNLERKQDKENPWNKGEELSDEEKVLSEILLQIVRHPFDRNLDFETAFHRRLGFIKNNKNKRIID